jgi:hypothetical protein
MRSVTQACMRRPALVVSVGAAIRDAIALGFATFGGNAELGRALMC